MKGKNYRQHRSRLQRIAHRLMLEIGLLPDFPHLALAELSQIHGFPTCGDEFTPDLRNLLWCSINNGDLHDPDELIVAEAMPEGAVKILVAITDVDAVVNNQSTIDGLARYDTTLVYTTAETYPMPSERLTTDLTPLDLKSDRLAIIIEFVVSGDGWLQQSDIYKATVRNHAKLADKCVTAWLNGEGPMPQEIGTVGGLEENLRLQDSVAQRMQYFRHLHGRLDIETVARRRVFVGDKIKDLEAEEKK